MLPRVARGLRERGFDAQAINGERTELRSKTDQELLSIMALESRAIVTNDIRDFRPIHDRFLSNGEEHAGLIFTRDSELPRSKAAVGLWVDTLESWLRKHPEDGELENRITFIL